MTSMCSRPLDKVTTSTRKPAAVDQEAAACMPLSHYHHQAHTFNATTPYCHYSLSPKSVCPTEDVTKTGPTQETTSSALLTSELAIINHHPLLVVLNKPLHNPSQSCINFACYAPAVEATTSEYDHYSLSPKSVCPTEDVTKTGPTQETTSSALLTSELAIINHHPLPVVLNKPLHNPSQSCINFACYAPAVEATTSEYDGYESPLRLTTVPEQESLRGYEGNMELAS